MSDQRAEFVYEMIESFINAGCSLEEVKQSVEMTADVLEAVSQSDVHPADFVKACQSKESFVGLLDKVPWAGIGSAIGGGATRLLDTGANAAGRMAEGAINNALPLAIMGPLAAGAAGYGAGQLVASIGDDPNERINEIKHQELLSALRRNARRLQGVSVTVTPDKDELNNPED